MMDAWPSQPEQAWSVSMLNTVVKQSFDTQFPRVWLYGEVSNLSTPPSGHVYLTLKDDRAQIACACFRGSCRGTWEVGQAVLAFGRVTLYEPRGTYQMIIESWMPAGVGQLQWELEALRKRLAQEGLFEHQRPLPPRPRHLAVVTSPAAAAWQDLQTVLARRFPLTPIRLYPSSVQGEHAVGELMRAVQACYDEACCDVLVVARGGGSLEDLWCFNDERLIRLLHASPIPVVSGVGHETDTTLVDWVADVRAPTPSAAAETVVPDQQALRQQLARHQIQLCRLLRSQVQAHQQHLNHVASRVLHPKRRLQERMQQVDQCYRRAWHAVRYQIQHHHQHWLWLHRRLDSQLLKDRCQQQADLVRQLRQHAVHLMQRQLEQHQAQLGRMAGQLQAMSPLKTLERGYALVTDPQDRVVTDIAAIQPQDALWVRLRHGRILTRVERKEES